MRRMLSILCAILILTAGCSASAPKQEEAYALYFRAADLEAASGSDALQAETVYLEGGEDREPVQLMEQLLNLLLEGPESAYLTNTIPSGTTLLSLELDGSWAKVDLSTPYRSLSGAFANSLIV